MATPRQLELVEELLDELGWDWDDARMELEIEPEDPEELTVEEASRVIGELIALKRVEDEDEEEDMWEDEMGW